MRRVSGFARPRGAATTATMFIAALAVMLMAAVPVEAVTATTYNTNLVKNPGAEQGSATSGFVGVLIPGWQPVGKFTVVAYGAPGGFPLAVESARIHGQLKFFSAGPYDNARHGCDTAVQSITIRGRDSVIDSGHVKVVLGARLGTYDTQPDTAHVTLSFRDASNHLLTTPHSGPLALTPVMKTSGTFKLETASKVVPQKARILRVTLSASNTSGYCDAYFDNITVKILAV